LSTRRDPGEAVTVAALWRYPVKSAAGEALRAASVEAGDAAGLGAGLAGDRLWGCLEDADGTVGSAKHPRRWGALLTVPTRTEASGEVLLEFAGREMPAGAAETDAALSGLLGRTVRLSRTVPAGARLHRLLPSEPGMVPDSMHASAGGELVTDIEGALPGGRFVDYGALHLVTTGALAELAEQRGAPVAAGRYRPNLVLDAPADPAPGTRLRIGEVVLRVLAPTPRCIVPSLPQPGVDADPAVLRTLAAGHRIEVPWGGRAACFGAYAEVLDGGRFEIGQPVTRV
jgi:uncharacterized protein YcbX